MFLSGCTNTKDGLLPNLAIGQSFQDEGRALFLLIYLYYICTDIFFLLKMKEKLTSGMPGNLEVILFALSWYLGI